MNHLIENLTMCDSIPLGDLSHAPSKPPSLTFGDFPEAIDNTMRSTLAACEKKFEFSFLSNLTPTGRSIHLHAGGAFASGMEAARRAFFERSRPADESISAGLEAILGAWKDFDSGDAAKSLPRMLGALEYYFSIWPLGDDYIEPWTAPSGERGIEFNFAIPLPIRHPQTGNPILYTGRFDMLGIHRNGSVLVEDEKTASQLGASWGRNWNLDSQFTGYCWGARQFGIPVAGALIRGISILKTKYDHAEVLTYRPPFLIDRWYAQLLRDVSRMKDLWQRATDANLADEASYALDKGQCNAYGGCSFEILCSSPTPERWVEVHFQTRDWKPMHRDADARPGPGLGTSK